MLLSFFLAPLSVSCGSVHSSAGLIGVGVCSVQVYPLPRGSSCTQPLAAAVARHCCIFRTLVLLDIISPRVLLVYVFFGHPRFDVFRLIIVVNLHDLYLQGFRVPSVVLYDYSYSPFLCPSARLHFCGCG